MGERARGVAWALGVLVVIQILHLLDSLRTDSETTFPTVLAEPQGVAGVGGTLLALVLVGRRHPWGRTLAMLAGVLVSVGFLVVHVLPFSSAFTNPYWGDGSADALQWLGVVAIWACSAVVVRLTMSGAAVGSSSRQSMAGA